MAGIELIAQGVESSAIQAAITQNQTIVAGTPGSPLSLSGNNSAFLDGSLLQGQTITAGGGNDVVLAGSNDKITLGGGNDSVVAGSNSTIKLGNGNDTVTAGASSTITVGNGNNTINVGNADKDARPGWRQATVSVARRGALCLPLAVPAIVVRAATAADVPALDALMRRRAARHRRSAARQRRVPGHGR
jgi:hypothetical protein